MEALTERRVAVHQPNYLPYLGYFYKMAKSDVFVYLDTVQFPRGQSFAARNRIKTPQRAIYLTVPVSIPRGRQGKARYDEIGFANQKWRRKHLEAVRMNYARAPHFEEVFEIYRAGVESGRNLVGLNIGLIEAFARYLSIDTERIRLSDILPSFGSKTALIVDICRRLGCRRYLSGEGARTYNDPELLGKEGIRLEYTGFRHPTYPQLWGRFIPNLCILDALFNMGKETSTLLK